MIQYYSSFTISVHFWLSHIFDGKVLKIKISKAVGVSKFLGRFLKGDAGNLAKFIAVL